MGKKILAVVIPPMGRAYSTWMDAGIDAMQEVVGGLVELMPATPCEPCGAGRTVDLWCNEEYLYRDDLPFCRAVELADGLVVPVYGQMLVTAATLSNGKTVSLAEPEMLSILADRRFGPPQLLDPANREAVAVEDDATWAALMASGLDAETLDANRLLADELGGVDVPAPPVVGEPLSMVARGAEYRIERSGGTRQVRVYDPVDSMKVSEFIRPEGFGDLPTAVADLIERDERQRARDGRPPALDELEAGRGAHGRDEEPRGRGGDAR